MSGDGRERAQDSAPADDTEDDLTVVSPRALDDDATIVRPRAFEEDMTIVRPRADDDQTVVRPRRAAALIEPAAPAAPAVPLTNEAPVADVVPVADDVPPRSLQKDTSGVADHETVHTKPARPPRPAAATDAQPSSGGASMTNRPVAPHTYRARQLEDQAPPASARVERQPDSAQTEHGVGHAAQRSGLPSFAKRNRKERVITLAAYAAAIVISIVGLIVVARIAFA